MRKRTHIMLTDVGIDANYNDGLGWAGVIVGDHVALISTEGIGYEVSTWEPEKMRDLFGTSLLDVTEQIEDADEKSTLDLAEHVRVFGARLERNVAIWARQIEEWRIEESVRKAEFLADNSDERWSGRTL